MDPNQNNDQASQIPGMPQDDSNTVPQPTPAPVVPETIPASAPEPEPEPEPTPAPVTEPEPAPVSEVPPPPPVVEENPVSGQADDTQVPNPDINQAV